MNFVSVLAAGALAQAVPPAAPADDPDQIRRCEVSHRDPAGLLQAGMLVGGAGQGFEVWASWTQGGQNADASFNVHWGLDRDLRVVSATAEVEVPARKARPGHTLVDLRRPDGQGPIDMTLNGPLHRFLPGSDRAVATVPLNSLLAYADDSDRLRWSVHSPGSQKVRRHGEIALAPLRKAVAALPGLIDELAAKQARYRSECSPHVEEPQI
jgi:hypothetical protein